MKICLLLFALVGEKKTQGQLVFQQLQHNYGTLDLASGLVSQFVITNTGAQEVEVQKLDAGKGFTWTFSNTFLRPGQSDTLTLIFRPRKAGPVNEKIVVYFENGVKPITLEMKGEVKKTAENGYQIYYRNIDPLSLRPVELPYHVFTVQQKDTKMPIPDAFVQIMDGGEVAFSGYSDKEGKVRALLNLGEYEIRTRADGFIQVRFSHQLVKTAQQTDILLIPDVEAPPILASTNNSSVPSDTSTSETQKAKEDTGAMPISKYAANNLVLIIDVSTSMGAGPMLPLLKKTLKSLVNTLRPIDRISIITFAERAELILPSTPVENKALIIGLIENLHTEGLTYPNKCIEMGYATLTMNYVHEGANQMFLFTDGILNTRTKDEQILATMKANTVKLNTSFTVIGLGKNDKAAPRLMELAQKGGGDFFMVTQESEINEAIVGSVMKRSMRP